MDRLAARCHPGPVTSSDDLSPPRRPLFFPVVIATVFLTIIGMTGGFVLGERRNNAAAVGPDTSGIVNTQPNPAPRVTVPGSGKSCPPETIAKAGEIGLPTDLRQVMKIQTTSGTTVWICADGEGALFYQGKTGGLEAPLEQGRNGLLLPGVTQVGSNHYEVRDLKGNHFTVTDTRFEVDRVSGSDQKDDVITVE